MRPAPPQRILLLLPRAFSPAGGLEAYGRLLIRALDDLARDRNVRWRALILNDAGDALDGESFQAGDVRAFNGRKARFAATALASAVTFRPRLVICGHVHFGSLILALRLVSPGLPYWMATYGVDVWRRLPLAQRLALRGAERVLSISGHTRDVLCRLNGVDRRHVDLLPCAVDPIWLQLAAARSSEDGRSSRPLVLTVARLTSADRDKGVEHALRAMALVQRDVPGVRYVVVGDGDDRARLEELARRVTVNGAVEFRGRVPVPELAHAYQESTLLLMPSRKEGFGIVFIEAAVFARPSIAARAGGAPEAVQDGTTGRLVSGDDVQETAGAVVEMLSDPERRRVMGQRAQEQALHRFSYETFRTTLARYVDGEPEAGTAPDAGS